MSSRRAWVGVALCCVALGAWRVSEASALRFCDKQPELSADQQDKLIRFGAIVKAELEASGQNVALVSRSGLNLSRFGVRYSHAGLSLKASQNTPWSVRQLYYACDEQKPRIFDQGMSGFVMGTDDASTGYVSIVLLPEAEADELERAALDNRQALQLLGASYSANAYPFSLRYQNCNQWVMELLAAAWGHLGEVENPRTQAQVWLKDQHYLPSVLDVGWRPLMWLGAFIPWVHGDDHPADDLAQSLYRVSMPASIEAFVRGAVPGATRIELCHTDRQVVIRHGWDSIPEGCQAGEQDAVLTLE